METERFFEDIFNALYVAVAVCEAEAELPLVYHNPSASVLAPSIKIGGTKGTHSARRFKDMFRFESDELYASFVTLLMGGGSAPDFGARIETFEGTLLPVSLSVKRARLMERDYFVIYIHESAQMELLSLRDINNVMSAVFSASYHTGGADDAINTVLGIMGEYTMVDRAYIFEELSPVLTANTYEWCGPGVPPVIDGLRELKKSDYPYDTIINNGMYVADDVRQVPDDTRALLEPQGIKALVIIPLMHDDRAIGYVGFDDCRSARTWSTTEIQLLRYVANILVSLILRRDADMQVKRSIDVLQTVSDNVDSIIYVSSLDTYEIIFVNKTLENSLGIAAADAIGKPCYSVMQKGQAERCPFCPLSKMEDKQGKLIRTSYTWEHRNTVNNRWYLARDAIIKWNDGSYVHIETATEITRQKEYERELEHYASIDSMTGAFNREWGGKLMDDMHNEAAVTGANISLCFIDLDGLKRVNDSLGHETGDDMIIRTVSTIRSCIRESDAIIRWGGDEFILLLRCRTPEAHRIIANIEKAVDAINDKNELPYTLSFSHGITELGGSDSTAVSVDAIVAEADRLMYENKMGKRRAQNS